MSILEDRRLEEPVVEERLVVFHEHSASKQRRQMLMALGILCFALILVLAKDWQFWFPANTTAESVPGAQTASPSSANVQPKVETTPPRMVAPSHAKHKASPPAPPVAKNAPAAPATAMPEVSGPSIIATQRRALPPLEVEVIAGDSRRTLQPKNNTIKVDLQNEAAEPVTKASATTVEPLFKPAVEAPAQVKMSAATTQAVSRPVEPSYPLLAKQMKVQGAVVLQALIGRSGNIDDLRVLSGPAILSSAAMEAVRQWRFKPYLQAGQAVDTQARITVNFTISTF
jgi:protein TonB